MNFYQFYKQRMLFKLSYANIRLRSGTWQEASKWPKVCSCLHRCMQHAGSVAHAACWHPQAEGLAVISILNRGEQIRAPDTCLPAWSILAGASQSDFCSQVIRQNCHQAPPSSKSGASIQQEPEILTTTTNKSYFRERKSLYNIIKM